MLTMGKPCTVCAHAAVDAIDAALETGQPLRDLAVEYGLSRSALDRHRRFHLEGQTETGAGAEPSHDNGRAPQRTPVRPDAPKKKRSIPSWIWGFLAGFAACAAIRRPVGTDTGMPPISGQAFNPGNVFEQPDDVQLEDWTGKDGL